MRNFLLRNVLNFTQYYDVLEDKNVFCSLFLCCFGGGNWCCRSLGMVVKH